MSDNSKISWCDASWNPVRGCSRVSEGCRNCYAEKTAARFCGPGQPYDGLAKVTAPHGWTGAVRLVPEHLGDPLRWQKPRRIFVNSMSDLFHPRLTNIEIATVFGVMAAAPRHTFQVLTKRPARMLEWFRWARGEFTDRQRGIVAAPNTARAMLDAAAEFLSRHNPALNAAWSATEHDPWPLRNVWLGVSVENQSAADERVPLLLQAPTALRFLSCEPLIGAVELQRDRGWLAPFTDDHHMLRGAGYSRIDWVIAGCESGTSARPCQIAWLRSLRDQCAPVTVPFFLKQAVEESSRVYPSGRAASIPLIEFGDGSRRKTRGVIEMPYLDRVQHGAFPAVAP